MNLLFQINTRHWQTAVSSFWALISGVHCPVLRDTFFFGTLCVAKQSQNVSTGSSDILADHPVITTLMWPRHRRRTAPGRFALRGVKKARGGRI